MDGMDGSARPPRMRRSFSEAASGPSSSSSSRTAKGNQSDVVTADSRDGQKHTTLEALDIPISYREAHALLDSALGQAMESLQSFRDEISSEHFLSETDNELDSDNDEDGNLTETEEEDSAQPRSHRRISTTKDVELLEAFFKEAYQLLHAIREDVQAHLPSLPSAQGMRQRFPNASATVAAADPRAVLESLSHNWHRSNELLQHLSMYSPISFSLPEMPAAISAISSSARRRFSVSFSPSASSASTPSSEQPPHMPSTSASAFHLPTPPLSAVRAFLSSESAKLHARVPSASSFEEWKEGISTVLHDASHYVQDRKDKIKDFVEDEAEKLKNALQHGTTRLLHYSELPTEWRNNQYILSGYRFVPIDRPGELIWGGLTTMHNETINIYTHLLPALYIIYYIAYVFPSTPLGDPIINTVLDRFVNLTFLIASLVCLLLSAAWHVAAGCGTWHVFHSCATLDYLGISALISSSVLTLTHQGFRCSPSEDLTYGTTICLFGALGLILPWQAWFNKREYKNTRISFFLLLAGVGAAPMIHMTVLYGPKATWVFYSPVVYSLLAYVAGLVFYAADFPESLQPGGLFDTLFHSHQFWHCAIVAAIALHWWALTNMSEKGLTGYSCVDRSPHSSQFLLSWLQPRDEL